MPETKPHYYTEQRGQSWLVLCDHPELGTVACASRSSQGEAEQQLDEMLLCLDEWGTRFDQE